MSAAAIGAGLDAFTGILTTAMTNQSNNNINKDNIITQTIENQKNRDWQSEENRKANEWQEKMWRMQNEYNTPLEQRKRLQEAGYNPWISGSAGPQSLAGSAGAGAHGGAAQVGVGSSVPMMPPNIGGLVQALVADSSVSNQNAKTLNELLDVYSKCRARGMSHEDSMKVILPFAKSLQGLNSEIDLVFEGARTDYDRNVLAKKQDQLSYDINEKLSLKERQTALEVAEQNYNEIVARCNLMGTQAQLNRQKIKESVTQCLRNIADAYKLRREGDKYMAEASTINAIRESVKNVWDNKRRISDYAADEADVLGGQRRKARAWQNSDEGADNALGNQKLKDDKYRNAVISSFDVVDPLLKEAMESIFIMNY